MTDSYWHWHGGLALLALIFGAACGAAFTPLWVALAARPPAVWEFVGAGALLGLGFAGFGYVLADWRLHREARAAVQAAIVQENREGR